MENFFKKNDNTTNEDNWKLTAKIILEKNRISNKYVHLVSNSNTSSFALRHLDLDSGLHIVMLVYVLFFGIGKCKLIFPYDKGATNEVIIKCI